MQHARKMNAIYEYQRYIYDWTRKFFLLGRDDLLETMSVQQGDQVLEMGCGTARNLIKLARLRSGVHLYGLDASSEMLKSAQRNLRKAGQVERIRLVEALAEELDYRQMFALREPFDTIFFSYALSMIPTWQDSINTALENLKPGHPLYIVDFWDQQGLPRWFRVLLQKWIGLFSVEHRPELIQYLQKLEAEGKGRLELSAVRKRYAYIARFEKAC